jgi:hypothetical protein
MIIHKNDIVAKLKSKHILIFLILGLALFLRARLPDASYLNVYAARDIQRSILLLEGKEFQWYGSETTYTKRLPGPFLYFLQLPALMVTYDPIGLIVWIALLTTIAIYLIYKIGEEFLGKGVGLYAALLWAVFPLSISSLRWYWNPVYIFPFITLALYLVLQMTLRGKTYLFPVIIGLILLSGQLHLSAYFLFISLLLIVILFKIKPSRRDILLTLLIVLVVNIPYFIAQESGIEEVEKVPLIRSFKRETRVISFNPNFFTVLKQNSCVQDNEHVTNTGFVDITTYFQDIESHGTAAKSFFLRSALLGSNILWIFLWAGILFSVADSLFLKSFRSRIKNERTITSTKALLILFLWILPASLGLMFWNYSDPQKLYPREFLLGNKVYSCIPHRYFFVMYPVQFLLIGYVIGLLNGHVRSIYHCLLKSKIPVLEEKTAAFLKKIGIIFILCFFIVPQLYLSYHFVSDVHESKIWGYHCGYRFRPIYTVGCTKELIKNLIQQHGLTLQHLMKNKIVFFLVYGFIDRELEIDYFFHHLERIFPGIKWQCYENRAINSSRDYLVVTDQPRERWDAFMQNSRIIEENKIFKDPGVDLKIYHVISDPQYPPPEYLNWRNPYFDTW